MSSKFHIELGQGTVSVEGEEEFVKAAFCALQTILTATDASVANTDASVASKDPQSANLADDDKGKVDNGANSGADSGVDAPGGKTAAEEFGNPGEILERIRDSLSGDEEDKEAVA